MCALLQNDTGERVPRWGVLAVVTLAVTAALTGFAGGAAAVPSPDDEHTLTQPDGTTFEAVQWGNEHNHGWEAANGYTITRGANDWWWYATTENGTVVPTDRKVGIDGPPPRVPKHVRGDAQTSPELDDGTSDDGPRTVSSAPSTEPQPLPSTGTVNLPVVLINYTDTTTEYTTTDFQSLLFGDNPAIASGPGSMADFYEEASYGELNLTGGDTGVTGWETADNTHDYYGENYTRAAELAREAVVEADPEMNFSQYDNNGDGYVDGVIVVHQGPGQEATGDASDIWSHRWDFTSAGLSAYQTDEGVTVNSYSLQPETYNGGITTVGVVAHETGHLFGLPDLYDTNGGSEGIGDWGLMGGGSWNGITRAGDSPAHPVAFHKWKQGWVTPTERPLTGPMGTLDPYTSNPSVFRWLDNPNGVEVGGTGEYFLASNRRLTGFDRGLPGPGMLITHIDESQTSNDNEDRKLVDVEAADGAQDMDKGANRGDDGDPFPGSTGTKSFNASTTPNSLLYDGTLSGLNITHLDVDGSQIEVNPGSLVNVTDSVDYGTIRYTTTASANVTVANDRTEPLNVTSTSITGTDAGNFTISAGGGERIISPSASAELNVTFQPADRGNYSATLRVEHNASGSPSTVSLAGAGGAPDYNVTPSATVDFGNVSVEDGNAQAEVVVENNGTLVLDVSDASISGANASDFSLAAGSATPPSSVASGSTVTYTVNVAVDSLGQRTAFLELAHDVPDREPINLTLSATGVDRNPPTVEAASAASSRGTAAVGPNGSVTLSADVRDAVSVQTVTANVSVLGAGTVTLTDENADSVYNTTVDVDAAKATEGVHALTIEGVDTSGHSATNATNELTVDLSPPALSIDAPGEGGFENTTSVDVAGTATDDLTAPEFVEVRNDSGTWTRVAVTGGSWSYEVASLSEGEHTVSVRATDNVSNTGPVQKRNVTVDLSTPVIDDATLDATDDVLPETSIGVTVSASDDVSFVSTVTADATTLQADAGAWAGNATAAPALGPDTATVTVVDAAGNRNTTALAYDVGRDATLQDVNGSTYRATPTGTPVVAAVSMNATTNVSGRRVTVGTATANPTDVAANNDTALYFPQVNTTVANANISNATVSLRLAKQRFDSQYVRADSTAFWVRDGTAWTRLNATLQNETDTAYVYDLYTDHFSTFAVTGDTEDTPPTISDLRPSDGSSTTDRTPTIAASYSDDFSGIDASSVTLSIDDSEVSSGLSVSSSEVSYSPDSALDTGSRSITVAVTDNAGNVQSRSWTFTVEESTVDSGGGGGGAGGGGGGTGGSGGGGGQTGGTATTATTTTTVSNVTTTVTTTSTVTPTATTPEPTTPIATTSEPTTPTATTETTVGTATATTPPAATTRGGSGTSGSVPGFGIGAALVAVLGAALLALRRDV